MYNDEIVCSVICGGKFFEIKNYQLGLENSVILVCGWAIFFYVEMILSFPTVSGTSEEASLLLRNEPD